MTNLYQPPNPDEPEGQRESLERIWNYGDLLGSHATALGFGYLYGSVEAGLGLLACMILSSLIVSYSKQRSRERSIDRK
ncbi:MAG: hypothetical protein AAFV88_00095 [Planctomycetota bacterium]